MRRVAKGLLPALALAANTTAARSISTNPNSAQR